MYSNFRRSQALEILIFDGFLLMPMVALEFNSSCCSQWRRQCQNEIWTLKKGWNRNSCTKLFLSVGGTHEELMIEHLKGSDRLWFRVPLRLTYIKTYIHIYIYIYIYIYIIVGIYIHWLCMPFLKMFHTKIKRKDIHQILVIFRLFTNLLQTNLSKKCKIVYVIRIVIKWKEQ